jgi:hypothetical protein
VVALISVLNFGILSSLTTRKTLQSNYIIFYLKRKSDRVLG